MGFLNKIKNLFYEEEELQQSAPVENKAEPKKEAETKEVKNHGERKDVEEIVSERELLKTEPTFKFPVIFEDEDFKEVKKEKKSINVLEAENNKYKIVDTKTIKEEKKIFKPSPVISPIYGILDKNYKKSDIVSKDGLLSSALDEKVDVDSVMKKAYGETVIVKEVSTREEKFYGKVDDEPTENTEINLFVDTKEEEPKPEEKEENYEEESYDLDEIDKKIKSIDELLKDTNDDDFYSLVDSMYKDEGDEE